jgi:hypothetical protein
MQKFKRINPIQFIAALGDPSASSGTNASTWGLWRVDPGPRGVRLRAYETLQKAGRTTAPAGWSMEGPEFWIEEHGLIMEAPETLPAGQYLVTGDRQVTTRLTVHPADPTTNESRWELDEGSLQDVTHLPCRSAKYVAPGDTFPVANVGANDFPVKPGAEMPAVEGCEKRDYAVLFVVGLPVE